MNKTKNERDVKLQTFQRLWRDFPELWKICGDWNINFNACVPVVCVLDAEILNQRVIHDEWWVVLHEGSGAFQRRWIVDLEQQNRTLRVALKDELLLSQWSVEYAVCRQHDAREKQQLKIYKPAKGQTINDLCFNLKTLV